VGRTPPSRGVDVDFSHTALEQALEEDVNDASVPEAQRLKALLMTYNKDRGFGGTNRGRYSNAKVDAFTEDALQTVDDVKRAAYLQRATEIVINDTGIIPLHFQVNTWAARNGITYVPRVDETTLAWKFKPRVH
jgi:ABC-type transport system substrate-binding protein